MKRRSSVGLVKMLRSVWVIRDVGLLRLTRSSNFLHEQSTVHVGSGYSLYGGNVKGTYLSLTPHTEIVQTWMLQSPSWPEGKFFPAAVLQYIF